MFTTGFMNGVAAGGWVIGFVAVVGGILLIVGIMGTALLYVAEQKDEKEADPFANLDDDKPAGARVRDAARDDFRRRNRNPGRVGGHDC